MPLRLLARAAPLVLAAVAAAIWLRRRRRERPALPSAVPPLAAPRAPAPARRSSNVKHGSERRSVDIVTVVDDLLGTPR